MADETKYVGGGTLTLGSKRYTLSDIDPEGDYQLKNVDSGGAFDERYLNEDEITELIDELGAVYEAPTAEPAAEGEAAAAE